MIDPDTLDPDRPVLIAGPTASGKSALAMRIAQRAGGMIVNADALQAYACWRVLTARPTPEDAAACAHRLYGHVACDATYSVGDWLRDVARLLRDEPGLRPIFVGGTGLNFTALTEGLADIPPIPAAVRNAAEARLAAEGPDALAGALALADPKTLAKIDARNPARVRRAWEVLQATGQGLADWQERTAPPLLATARCHTFVLEAERDWLEARMARRLRLMLEGGALKEVRARRDDWNPALPSSRAIGAAQLMAHLEGRLTLDEAEAAALIATRQYAKRQRTWFRAHMAGWTAIRVSG